MVTSAPLQLPDESAIAKMAPGQIAALLQAYQQRDERRAHEIHWRDAKIDQLSFEIAQLRRQQYGRRSERLGGEQKALFDEAIAADIAAVEAQLEQLRASLPSRSDEAKRTPKRAALPASLPRREIRHEPEHTDCGCGAPMQRISEDVAEKLDYTPGVFTVERHIRGKWACAHCRTLTQAPVPAAVIDKGIPTAGLLAQVLVAKHADHLPLYRQEQIFGRAGLAIPRATLAAWVGQCGVQLQPLVEALKDELLGCAVLHADETPVAMLAPGTGKTHRAYLWAYAAGPREPIKAVVYDFADSRSGEHARRFLGHGSDPPDRPPWTGRLVCDDFAGYKALFAQGVTEVGCMAHARRKFVELQAANQSTIATEAIELIRQLYAVERDVHDLDDDARRQQRQARAQPIAKTLHDWLTAHRARVTDGTATAKAIDYSLNRWTALTRYLTDARLPIDNNHDEQQIRPWATGRKNWLFAGTLAAGQRAAAIASLIQTAKLNGHDPYAYVKNVLERLPTQRASRIGELLPHRWSPTTA
ncbi:MAG: IS66 family transposase [Burkholderiales bacterium]|jgi:transposase|nr:IS66 family transposase [Burkholderiales bacterium]